MKNIFFIMICIFLAFLANNIQSQTSCVNVLYTGSIASQFQYMNNIYMTVNQGNCAGIAGGRYFIDGYRIEFDVQGNFTNGTVTVVNDLCNGWYDIHHNPCRWGGVSWQTDQAARLYTYVWYIKAEGGGVVGWFPNNIANARVAYQICKTIPSIVFNSNMPIDQVSGYYKLGLYTNGYLSPRYTTNVNCYNWCLKKCNIDDPCQILIFDFFGVRSVTPNNGPTFGLFNYNYNYHSCDVDIIGPFGFTLFEKLTMGNVGGCSQQVETSSRIQPLSTPIGGCPWIWVQTDTGLVPENNAFHKSEFEEFNGNDITDLYVLQNKPMLDSNNNVTVELAEATSDYTVFDQVKMYKVDHPEGTKLDVTENGDIVIYNPDEVGSTDYATLNAENNITTQIQYANIGGNEIIKGEDSDSIYAHYDTTNQRNAVKLLKSRIGQRLGGGSIDSLALIGRLGHNQDYDYITYPNAKDWAGNVTIYLESGSVEKLFARREISSDIIIPFGNLDASVDHIDVNFTSDYEVTYFSVVPISYYGYIQTALPLIVADHNVLGDILSSITNKDNDYAYLDSTCLITLRFRDETSPEQGWIRDYVMEFSGQYIVSGENNRGQKNIALSQKLNIRNENPYSFKLFTNYPNPFNPKTTIKYSISKDAQTYLLIYNAIGQLVATLVSEYQKAGEYEVSFNAENYPSGVYFYRLESGDLVSTKKMVLIK